MKIVKKTNGNIVILNTNGTVKQVIQQTGVQMLLEGNEIKLIQNGYPIGYIDAAEVTHTQIEPSAEVAFSGSDSDLMMLLAEDFFILSTATDSDGWVETTIDISSAQILAMGTTPIELLPAPGAGKYYNIESLIIEYTYITTPYTYVSPSDMLWIYGLNTTYAIGYIGYATNNQVLIKSKQEVSELFDIDNVYTYAEDLGANNVVLSTFTGTNWTLGDGTIKIKIKYKIETFG